MARRTKRRRTRLLAVAWLAAALCRASGLAADDSVERGEVQFVPADPPAAEVFRLPRHTFAYEQVSRETSAERMRLFDVTFPSPVKTPHEANNTVHCEYFRPAAEGRYPGVIVLHILGGDFDLARLFCRALAHRGVCALFLKMPYYGPRRQEGVDARMISPDPEQTVRGMRQAVLDVRRATAWLGSRREVDPRRLGVFGISLGGITAALAATAEPRLHNVFLMLAGGDVATVAWDAPEAARLRRAWTARGGTREALSELLRPVDPVTHGRRMAGRRIRMMNARFDEVIPRASTESLWRAFGRPEIVWLDCGHYSAMRFVFDALVDVTQFFGEAEPLPPKR